MKTQVNGKTIEVDDGATLETVVSKIGMQGPVAVSLNDEVVPYKKLAEHKVAEGDVIEIFTMLGGGVIFMYALEDVDIYPVTGRNLYGNRSDSQVVGQLAEGGAKMLQLRDKTLNAKEFYDLAILYRQLTTERDMLFIVNDWPDIAVAVGADGVHLGQSDMPIETARKSLGTKMIIGASAHSCSEAITAQKAGASYVNVGPIFETPTKPSAVGIGAKPLAQAVAALDIPVSTMGGIVRSTIDEVLATGVGIVGVVSAIFGEDDVTSATSFFANKIGAVKKVK